MISQQTTYFGWYKLWLLKGDDGDFCKVIGKQSMEVVIKGWKHSMITFEDGTTNLKLEVDWTGIEWDFKWRWQKHIQADQHMFKS